jgi:hypothetical protein
MSQEAGAPQLKRSQSPAYVYGPLVYQFAPEREVEKEMNEKEKPKSNQGINFLILGLIVILVVGGVVLYLKENGIDVKRLSFRPPFGEQQEAKPAIEIQQQPPVIIQARVAADRLYLREGPGMEYVATYLLPENWGVSLIGDYLTDNNGEVWARVSVETDEGLREGWVSRRFVE